jgi:hypothetical protein
MGRFFGRLMKRAKRLGDKVDQYQEAITFAEAGQPSQAQELVRRDEVEEKALRLLVVGRESTFSREVVDYALEMAQRLSYQILALNTAPLSCETFKIFSSSRKKICQDFQSLSEENVKAFREEAEKFGIPFTHVIKFSEREEALEEVREEFGGIEFVVSDMEEERAVDRVEDRERARKRICVYSMV